LSSYLGKARYVRFPDAIARRYDGIGIGWQSNLVGDTTFQKNETHLVICVGDKIFPDDLPVMWKSVRRWRPTYRGKENREHRSDFGRVFLEIMNGDKCSKH